MRKSPNVSAHQLLKDTTKLQRDAADPNASVWVSANAGTGKTHVLTNRVLRLLLVGIAPERILCVTYTKAAAALMSQRIFNELATWVMANEDALTAKLEELTGSTPTESQRDLARTLFTKAIETPGGLKIQTIHGFCERLLKRFPIEAGIAPEFKILDEQQERMLIRQSIDKVLVEATGSSGGRLADDLNAAIAYASDDYFDDILTSALDQRAWLSDLQMLYGCHGTDHIDQELDVILNRYFGLPPNETEQSLRAKFAQVLDETELKSTILLLRDGGKKDNDRADCLAKVLRSNDDAARIANLKHAFLKKDGGPIKDLMVKKLAEKHPSALTRLEDIQNQIVKFHHAELALRVISATKALYRIADAVMQKYTDAKRRQAALDFDDLISKSVLLLQDREEAEWVLFKLDEGLSHILVDESQDTSPEQWQLVSALAQEFFTGQGAHDKTRTIFAVGDEKQSIYSFQGAAPHEFANQGKTFAALSQQAQKGWRDVALTLSFRTTEPVLQAVDQVFSNPNRTSGISSDNSKIEHAAIRLGQAGLVELWPLETADKPYATDPWLPLDREPTVDTVASLADRIARTIHSWLQTEDCLQSTGQPIQPKDILILVRKRQPFASAMVSALKRYAIPVAGADRMRLLDQIAIQDLLALADFLTLPEDDLSLAALLKSPIFGFDDDDLLLLAPKRKLKTLWKALLDAADSAPKYAFAAETLKRWRKLADFTPPYEFFARLFDSDGVREKLIGRLGPDTAEALDAFTDLTLKFDEAEAPSLAGFLTWLRSQDIELKRDLETQRNEVRVLTVHGAKGDEAPIVFLPDTTTAPSNRPNISVLKVPAMQRPDGISAPFLWAIKDSSKHPAISAAKQAQQDLEQEESDRLLYVAMTRARDRLYISGFQKGTSKGFDKSWYALIEEQLKGSLKETETPDGTVWRLSSEQVAPLEVPKSSGVSAVLAEPPPAWASQPAELEPRLSIPITPSRLAPFEIDDEGEPQASQPALPSGEVQPMSGPLALDDNHKFLRGNLTHALLQFLPDFPTKDHEKLARAFVNLRANQLPVVTRDSIVAETLAILTNPTFAPLFGKGSRPEVPIVADIPNPSGQGPALRLNGAIDRMVELDDEIFVVDFKTNRRPPASLDEIADAYLYQLASYRLALGQIYPNHTIRAALLWTDGPEIMEISRDKLEAYQQQLWTLRR